MGNVSVVSFVEVLFRKILLKIYNKNEGLKRLIIFFVTDSAVCFHSFYGAGGESPPDGYARKKAEPGLRLAVLLQSGDKGFNGRVHGASAMPCALGCE